MKTYVLTLSKVFPKTHKRAGEPTDFELLFKDNNYFDKIHTIRANYPLWKQRISEIQAGRAVLSVRQWTGNPYRSKQVEKLPMWIVEQWRWYFDYLAALVKVNNPRLKVELTTCAQTLKQGQEYIEEKSKTLLRAKESKLKRLKNTPVQDDLFNYASKEQDRKIQAVQGEIDALNRGEFNYYVPPTYINSIKKWIKR